MKKLLLANAIVAFVSVLSSQSMAVDLRGIQNNNRGAQDYKNERLNDAYQKFVETLSDLPFQPEVHYNLGRVFYENKEYDKAYQESMTASRLAPKDSDVRFEALFQAASALAQQKKVDDAIAMYQQALEIKPDSKETKTNIELLIEGGGQGEGDQNKDQGGGGKPKEDKDKEGKDDKQPPQQQPQQKPNATPRPFKSEDLSKKDVENILDELNRQEEQIRAKFQREGAKDAPRDKDW